MLACLDRQGPLEPFFLLLEVTSNRGDRDRVQLVEGTIDFFVELLFGGWRPGAHDYWQQDNGR